MEGLAFHCHHGTLFEYCHDYQERVDYIKNRKPKNEQELRLRLFKMIPDELLPKGWEKVDKAIGAYNKAWDAYVAKSQKELQELHARLCPDCTWNGETIFPGGVYE